LVNFSLCKFCIEHGKGTKWYLNPANYRDNLLQDKRRKELLERIAGWGIDYYLDSMIEAASYAKTDLTIRKLANEAAPNEHAGQVVSLEDAVSIVDLSDNHILLPCMCRKQVHATDDMVCLNFGPVKELFKKLKPSQKLEPIDQDEAKTRLKEWDRKGLIHTVLYAVAPYPVVLCNCDRTYCTALKQRLIFGIEYAYLKGHQIAMIDPVRCDGCSSYGVPRCVHRCSFGALQWDRTEGKAVVDPFFCFGCGVCRVACDKGAIRLAERERVPTLKNAW